MCGEPFDATECANKTQLFREVVTREFQRMLDLFEDEHGDSSKRSSTPVATNKGLNKPKSQLCLSNVKVATVRPDDLSNSPDSSDVERKLKSLLPRTDLFPSGESFKSCAVISSAGSLINSNLGAFVDAHEVVMRFNHAPTQGYEMHVGSKTTIRVVNSQVVSKPEYGFLNNSLFANISIAAWDPGNNNATLSDWIEKPDFDLFTNYNMFMGNHPHADAHLIDPRSLWRLWTALQSHFPQRSIRRNPPSSGFIGIALLLPHCETIDVVEYVPSTRLSGRCHYYEEQVNAMCTFGSWHPLAAEKLMLLDLNSADEFTTFQQGILRIKPKRFKC